MHVASIAGKKQGCPGIGAGAIGGELAAQIARRSLGEVVLFDVPEKEGVCKGKALDLMQDGGVNSEDNRVIDTSSWSDCADSDLVVVSAGVPRRPGQSRNDLIGINLPIIRKVAINVKHYCPDAIAIIISNPLDLMVYEFKKTVGWSRERVIGMAGILDTARFSLFVAEAAGVSVSDVRTMVLGGHGDQMVPLTSFTAIHGVPASELLSPAQLEAIANRTAGGGGEILKLIGRSAWSAPASAARQMVDAILHDSKRMLPCSVELAEEYGGNFRGLFLGVPVVLGAHGVEKIVELPLSPAERAQLDNSARAIREVVEISNRM